MKKYNIKVKKTGQVIGEIEIDDVNIQQWHNNIQERVLKEAIKLLEIKPVDRRIQNDDPKA